MGLWVEHLGGRLESVFNQPQSRACLERVNGLADANWRDFSGEEPVDMKGHLVRCGLVFAPQGHALLVWLHSAAHARLVRCSLASGLCAWLRTVSSSTAACEPSMASCAACAPLCEAHEPAIVPRRYAS